ncbi:hypothetical protein Ahy_B04g069314 [Arachis hypogaea]|uniref:FAR1 domain-containing protein n=1 Tax=Arachis hypogaea TaxID=3818 RepID=A0A444ZC96_ARAHY|nr:hypothetical protein Ahy_B04g069314 [Arachis hypogaea]
MQVKETLFLWDFAVGVGRMCVIPAKVMQVKKILFLWDFAVGVGRRCVIPAKVMQVKKILFLWDFAVGVGQRCVIPAKMMQIMNDSSSDCQLNQREMDCKFESNEVPEFLNDVDEMFVSKVGTIFNTLENAEKLYQDYSKVAGFSTRVQSTNKKGNEIKNQLTTCGREGKWKSKISLTEKTNPSAGLNCPERIYIHILRTLVLDHFQGRVASFTSLLCKSSRDA